MKFKRLGFTLSTVHGFNNHTSVLMYLHCFPLAKIVTDNLCVVRAFIDRDELYFKVSLPKFLDETENRQVLS